jgi:DNA-binding NarL/FixJ family response regulator
VRPAWYCRALPVRPLLPAGVPGRPPDPAGTEEQKITSLAAQGVAFTKIAQQTGHTLGTVRKVVHGVRNVRLVVRA